MNSQKKKPTKQKKCSCAPVRQFFYQLGGILVLGGLVVMLVGFSTQWLFFVRIYDLRLMTYFEHIEITVGLFGATSLMQSANDKVSVLEKPLDLSYVRWGLARFFGIVALIAAFAIVVIHICGCVIPGLKQKKIVIAEVTCQLLALATLMVSIGLAESEIYYLHDYGDENFFRMLYANKLMPSDPKAAALVNYDLFMSRPQKGYWVLAASDFTFLAAFLCSLPHLIVLCKSDELLQPKSARARNRERV